MRVLIITKPSNFEQHGEMVRRQTERGFVQRTYLEALERSHDEHYQTLSSLKETLHQSQIQFTELSRDEDWGDPCLYNAVFTVGGDGTILSASHHVESRSTPLIGIKSSNTSIGHLCAGDSSKIGALVQALAENKIQYKERSRLIAKISRLDNDHEVTSPPCLNDFLFTNIHPAATTRYHLALEGKVEMQRSSGIWISTATGSSAGIHAAGGQIMPPESADFQFKVREPFDHIRSPLRQVHGFFNPETMPLSIINQSDESLMAIDGPHLQLAVNIGDRITFSRASPLLLASALFLS